MGDQADAKNQTFDFPDSRPFHSHEIHVLYKNFEGDGLF